jgi:hypothetical protein
MSAILPIAQLLFVTFDDEHRLWGDETVEATLEGVLPMCRVAQPVGSLVATRSETSRSNH